MTKAEQSRIQKEIVDSTGTTEEGRWLLAPRTGKTKVAIDLIKRDKPKSILWVTPSSKLAEEDIPQEFVTWKAKRYIKYLRTTTWMSLNKIQGHFDLIILDEEQFLTENNAQNLLNGTLSGRIISMTGTASRHDHKKELYHVLDLSVIYEISINNAVDINLLADYTINVIEVDMSTKKDVQAGNAKKRFMTSEAKQYAYLDTVTQRAIMNPTEDAMFKILSRMRAIKNSKSKTQAAKYLIEHLEGRKLIFSATINQARELSDYRYHSKTNNIHLKQFIDGEIDEIAMVNAGGTGFTYKEVNHLILTQVDSDKNGLTSQKIARALLNQKNYKANIWILSLIGTQDEKWVKSVLQNFDSSKVKFLRFKNILEHGI